ncbi:MAG: group II intron reverse transcriptase/maturase, partial [Patescibacteria group bacterium]
MSLETPEKIRRFQRELYLKAKREPECRFHQLYDKLYREDILAHAYRRVRANGGAAGVDGEALADVEGQGLEGWLARLREELRGRTYKPSPVRRVKIPKEGGGERNLGIPTVRDRVVQTAAVVILQPVFEADMEDGAYGYRPKRSAQDAVKAVHTALIQGYTEVVDGDLSTYFDTIPHAALMQSVARRISDRNMLALIKAWLKVPIIEEEHDGPRRTSGGKDGKMGVPQGGVISPLLANIYINRLLKAWRMWGIGARYQARIINYADDFVILSQGRGTEALAWTRRILDKLGLTLNEAKTRVVNAECASFNFLGYTFGIQRGSKDGHP